MGGAADISKKETFNWQIQTQKRCSQSSKRRRDYLLWQISEEIRFIQLKNLNYRCVYNCMEVSNEGSFCSY